MSMQFYYGSGSPFAWTVWLTLEHKQLSYEFNLLSFQNGALKTPDYLAINPHGKVPALVDEGFALWETTAIVEYLEERYPEPPILPANLQAKATVRRLSAEAYNYLYPVLRKLMEQTLFRTEGDAPLTEIETTLSDLNRELNYFDNALAGDYFAGQLSAADFTLYPLLALTRRLHEKRPQLGIDALVTPKLAGFMQGIEQLPYLIKTIPPHWQG